MAGKRCYKNRGMKVIHVKTIYLPFRGICLAPFCIIIRKNYKGNFGLLRHEVIHWKQAKKMGYLFFYLRYLIQLLICGYDNMPIELEARQGESHYGMWNYRTKNFKQNETSNTDRRTKN